MKAQGAVVWRPVGSAPPGPVTALAARDRTTFLCGSLAGASLSRDGGRTWEWLAPGAVGPLVTAVVAGSTTAPTLLVAAASGLFLGDDPAGDWRSLNVRVASVTRLQDGRLAIVSPEGSVAMVDDSDAVHARVIGDLPGATAIAQSADGSMWVTVHGRLLRGDGTGAWGQVPGVPGVVADLVGPPNGQLVVLLEDGQVALGVDGESWTVSDPTVDGAMVAASDDGSLVAVLGDRGVAWTGDGGTTWTTSSIEREPTSLGVAADGSRVLVGTADGCVLVFDPADGTRGIRPDDRAQCGAVTAVVADVAWDERSIAVACPGTTWRTDATAPDAWEAWGRAAGWIDIAAVAVDSTAGDLAVVEAHALRGEGWALDLPSGVDAAHVALSMTPRGRDVVVTDGLRIWRWFPGEDGWSEVGAPDGGDIATVALGRPGDRDELTVLAGCASAGGPSAVWMLRDGRWITLGTGETGGARPQIVAVDGTRAVYAALGAVVFRPAVVGSALFAPEELPGAVGQTVLGLAATRGSEEDIVVALTARAIHVSRDGGIGWSSTALPDGPPATALALRTRPALEALVGRLGGELVALEV